MNTNTMQTVDAYKTSSDEDIVDTISLAKGILFADQFAAVPQSVLTLPVQLRLVSVVNENGLEVYCQFGASAN